MMKRQKNTVQMKKQGRNSQEQTNEEEISSLPEREFKVKIVKILWRLENRMEKIQEMFSIINIVTKDIEEIKNKQIEMNSIITEMKNTL